MGPGAHMLGHAEGRAVLDLQQHQVQSRKGVVHRVMGARLDAPPQVALRQDAQRAPRGRPLPPVKKSHF